MLYKVNYDTSEYVCTLLYSKKDVKFVVIYSKKEYYKLNKNSRV